LYLYKIFINGFGKLGLLDCLKIIHDEIKEEIDSNKELLNMINENANTKSSHKMIDLLGSQERWEEIKDGNIPIFKKSNKNINVREKMNKILFFSVIELSNQCNNSTCKKKVNIEDIIIVMSKDFLYSKYKCFHCQFEFNPFLLITKLSGKYFKIPLISPIDIIKEILFMISKQKEAILFSYEFYLSQKTLFWNLIFFFKILKLPLFIFGYCNPEKVG